MGITPLNALSRTTDSEDVAMRKMNGTMLSLLTSVALAACGGSSGPSSSAPGPINTLRQTPPATGATVQISSAVVVAGQATKSGKWNAYVQDQGHSDGIDLYCSPTSKSYPCTATLPAAGAIVSVSGAWDPYQGQDELAPTTVTAESGTGTTTYASASSSDVGEAPSSANADLIGAPVHLTGGPWQVTNLTPSALMNTNYQAMCAKGPSYFGFEVTDKSSGAKLYVTTDFYKTINFGNDSSCLNPGDTNLANTSTFTKLGGVVDVNNGVVEIKPFNQADYSLQ
jgi:hypothetical protein